MAKLSLTVSPKFKRLVAELRIPAPYVRGLLDTLWDSAHVRGSPVIGSAEDVEALAEWPGEPGKLVDALIRSGFIDIADVTGLCVLHDYWEHAPEYAIDKYRARIARVTGEGQMLRSVARRHAAEVYREILAGAHQSEAERNVRVQPAGNNRPSGEAKAMAPIAARGPVMADGGQAGRQQKRKRHSGDSPFVTEPPAESEVIEYIVSLGEFSRGDSEDLARLFLVNKEMSNWTWGPSRLPIVNWKLAVRQFLASNWKAEKLRKERAKSQAKQDHDGKRDQAQRTLADDRAEYRDVDEMVFRRYAKDVLEGRAKVGTLPEWLAKNTGGSNGPVDRNKASS